MSLKINWLAVLAIAVFNVMLGFVWYGMLFEQPWMAAVGLTPADAETANMGLSIGVSVVGAILASILISLILGAGKEWNLRVGLKWGLAIGLLLILPHNAALNNWAQRSWDLTLIDSAYALVFFAAAGALLGAWRPKGA